MILFNSENARNARNEALKTTLFFTFLLLNSNLKLIHNTLIVHIIK
jgi:hypothetical protein